MKPRSSENKVSDCMRAVPTPPCGDYQFPPAVTSFRKQGWAPRLCSSRMTWVQTPAPLLPGPVALGDCDFGASISSFVSWITQSLPRDAVLHIE